MKNCLVVIALLSTTALLAQPEPPFVTGLRAPVETAVTHQGNLIVAEEGGAAPNTGRISMIDRTSGARRTLVDGLPSALYTATNPPQPSGPDGLALQGSTLYVTIGSGNASVAGPVPSSDMPNPAGPSSPILSSLLSLHANRSLDTVKGDFALLPSQHAQLKNGERVTLRNAFGEELEIKLVADFPDYVSEPRTDFAGNVRISNPFGVVARGDALYVVDASMNAVRRVDRRDGSVTTLVTFAPLANPAMIGPAVRAIDAVPDSIRVRGNDLLVTTLTGFPFPAGLAEVRTIDLESGRTTTLISGLTSAIDTAPLGQTPTSPLLVLEFSTAMLAGARGQLQMFRAGREPVLVAGDLVTPTSITVDQRTGEIFITNIGPGMITRVRAAGLIPSASPNSIIAGIGSTAGAFGSRWVTAAQISNPFAFPISGEIVFHAAGTPAQTSDPSLSYTLGAFETRSYNDLVAAAGGSGIGSADVIAVGGSPTIVVRVFDDASPGKPSAQVPVVETANALLNGTRGTLITPSSANARFNVGIRTLGEGVTMTIERHNSSGAIVQTVQRSWGRNTFVQLPVADLLGAAAGPDEALTFSIDAGSAIVYGTGIDNGGHGLTYQITWPTTD